MSFYNPKVLTAANVDYRLLDKSALQSLSEIMSDILSKYDCTFAVVREFCINGDKEDITHFGELFDNAAEYDAISLYASGRSTDRTKRLDIMVAVNFTLPEPRCHITLSGKGITDAQKTDIFEAIGNFIYEAAKVESSIKSNNAANNPPASTKNTKPSKKRNLSKKGSTANIAGIITLVTAIITLIAVVIDKFF